MVRSCYFEAEETPPADAEQLMDVQAPSSPPAATNVCGRGTYRTHEGSVVDRNSKHRTTTASQTVESPNLYSINENVNSSLLTNGASPASGNVYCGKAKELILRAYSFQMGISRALGSLIPSLSDPIRTTSSMLGVGESTLRSMVAADGPVAEHAYAVVPRKQQSMCLPSCKSTPALLHSTKAKGERIQAKYSSMMLDKIRWMIHEQYKNAKHITISEFNEVLKKQLVEFDYALSDRSLCRLLNAIGFRYRRIRDRCVLFERRDLIDWRHRYLRHIRELRSSGAYIAYSDETWLFEGMQYGYGWTNSDSMKNPRDYMKRGWKLNPTPAPSKGKRGIVVGVLAEEGIINGTFEVWAECGMSDDADYHKTMDSKLYEKWLRQILPLVKAAANGRQAVLVVDNAPYHSQLIEKIPCPSSTKKVIIEFLESRGVSCTASMKKKAVLELFTAYAESQGGRDRLKRYRVDELASEFGVKLLRLPAYHCTLNPIEHFWGWLKSKLSKESGTRSKMVDLRANALKYVSEMSVEQGKAFYRSALTTEDYYIEKEHLLFLDVSMRPAFVVPLDDSSDTESLFDELADDDHRPTDLVDLDYWGMEEEADSDMTDDDTTQVQHLQSNFTDSAFLAAAPRKKKFRALPLP